jgi:hypothetical protein
LNREILKFIPPTTTRKPASIQDHRSRFESLWEESGFDLMGFSFKNNMLEIKEALREIDPAIYLYGEGCDFGEVANNASKS